MISSSAQSSPQPVNRHARNPSKIKVVALAHTKLQNVLSGSWLSSSGERRWVRGLRGSSGNAMNEEKVTRLNERQRKIFDRLYSRFLEPLPRDVLDRMERIVAAATIAPGETVLDVGTGTGALLPLINLCGPPWSPEYAAGLPPAWPGRSGCSSSASPLRSCR